MFYDIAFLPSPFCPEVEQSVILAPLRKSLFHLLMVCKSRPASHLGEANFLVRNQDRRHSKLCRPVSIAMTQLCHRGGR